MSGNGDAIRVQLLGPVRAWRGEHELALGGPRGRAVFGMLAMRAGRPVSRDELIDGLWGDQPPSSAVNSVHVYVAGLRRVLEPGRPSRAPGHVLPASGPGYLLRLDPGQLDTAQLDRQLADGRLPDGVPVRAADLAAAARSLDAALGLWQGIPLAGLPGPWAEVERIRLGELRLGVIEQRIDVLLALGQPGQVVAELARLIREHPLRERFREQLMLALYQCGRQADALAEFAAARRVLDTELGIEPGPGLRRLQRRILAADPALDLPAAPAHRRLEPWACSQRPGRTRCGLARRGARRLLCDRQFPAAAGFAGRAASSPAAQHTLMARLSSPMPRTRGRRREGLPCPSNRARSPTAPICGSSS